MKIKYEGKYVELTTEFIMEVGGVGRRAARDRINAYVKRKITKEQLLFHGSYTNNDCPITKGSITLTARQLSKMVNGLKVVAANKRLQAWKIGRMTYKQLLKPPTSPTPSNKNNQGSPEYQALGNCLRANPNSIPITPFEIEYGERKEKAWGYVDA